MILITEGRGADVESRFRPDGLEGKNRIIKVVVQSPLFRLP